MRRFGNGGSITLIASMSGSITNRVRTSCGRRTCWWADGPQGERWVSYNTSKSAVLQMARSMACELGTERIRVNTLSPGHIYTQYVSSNCNGRHGGRVGLNMLAQYDCPIRRQEPAPGRQMVGLEPHEPDRTSRRAEGCGDLAGKRCKHVLYRQRVSTFVPRWTGVGCADLWQYYRRRWSPCMVVWVRRFVFFAIPRKWTSFTDASVVLYLYLDEVCMVSNRGNIGILRASYATTEGDAE